MQKSLPTHRQQTCTTSTTTPRIHLLHTNAGAVIGHLVAIKTDAARPSSSRLSLHSHHLAQLGSFVAALGISAPSLAVPVFLPALDPDGQHHAQAQDGTILEEDLDHGVLPWRPLQAHPSVCLATLDQPTRAG